MTDPDRILFQGRVIALAMLLGVLIFAGVVVWMIGEGAVQPVDPEVGRVLVLVWGVVALGSAAAWYLFRGKTLGRLTSTRGLREIHPGDVEGHGRAFGSLVVAWSLAEAIGITGVTVALLTGRTAPLVGGVLGTALGVALTWPRSEWLSAFRQGRMPGIEEGGDPWKRER